MAFEKLNVTETAAALTEQTDGSLVVAGTVDRGGTADFLVARFNVHGAADVDFGNNGFAFADFNAIDTARAVAVRSDGAIAVAGCTTSDQGLEFAVAQFTATGDPDTSFNGTGKATLSIGSSGEDCAQAVAYSGTNRLILGGYASIFAIRQFALAAFETIVKVSVCTTSTTTTTTTITTTSTTTASYTTTTTLPPAACGDANDDAKITASDALVALRTAVGTSACDICICDADNSGVITTSDALRILRVAVGLDDTLDCPTPCEVT